MNAFIIVFVSISALAYAQQDYLGIKSVIEATGKSAEESRLYKCLEIIEPLPEGCSLDTIDLVALSNFSPYMQVFGVASSTVMLFINDCQNGNEYISEFATTVLTQGESGYIPLQVACSDELCEMMQYCADAMTTLCGLTAPGADFPTAAARLSELSSLANKLNQNVQCTTMQMIHNGEYNPIVELYRGEPDAELKGGRDKSVVEKFPRLMEILKSRFPGEMVQGLTVLDLINKK